MKGAGVPDSLVSFADNILTLSSTGLRRLGLSADSIATPFGEDAMRVQGVMRADLVSRLPSADTTHDADAHVPLVFAGRWIRPSHHTEFVRTVDLAPTRAVMLGVKPLEPLDGRALTGVNAGSALI